MGNCLVKKTCIRGKVVVVSAIRQDGRVKVEAARAQEDAESAVSASKVQIVNLQHGAAILSSADFLLSDDENTNNARLAHALMCCCAAVMGARETTKGGRS
ncbi:MAG TPA: hypothetical protein DCL51_09575 [Ruthenibacterium lactatiformans]|nr:hypothetical protein [Ruthenibacterium lactatiformans]